MQIQAFGGLEPIFIKALKSGVKFQPVLKPVSNRFQTGFKPVLNLPNNKKPVFNMPRQNSTKNSQRSSQGLKGM